MSTPEANTTSRQPESEQNRPSFNPIDLSKLADKVYRLMLADIRLERARGVPAPRQKRD